MGGGGREGGGGSKIRGKGLGLGAEERAYKHHAAIKRLSGGGGGDLGQ